MISCKQGYPTCVNIRCDSTEVLMKVERVIVMKTVVNQAPVRLEIKSQLVKARLARQTFCGITGCGWKK